MSCFDAWDSRAGEKQWHHIGAEGSAAGGYSLQLHLPPEATQWVHTTWGICTAWVLQHTCLSASHAHRSIYVGTHCGTFCTFTVCALTHSPLQTQSQNSRGLQIATGPPVLPSIPWMWIGAVSVQGWGAWPPALPSTEERGPTKAHCLYAGCSILITQVKNYFSGFALLPIFFFFLCFLMGWGPLYSHSRRQCNQHCLHYFVAKAFAYVWTLKSVWQMKDSGYSDYDLT